MINDAELNKRLFVLKILWGEMFINRPKLDELKNLIPRNLS
jgi:hypothetical protein